MNIKSELKNLRRRLIGVVIHSFAKHKFVSADTVVIVAPHPDDETFACGGLIALKRLQGISAHVIFLSRGEGAHQKCCATSGNEIGDARSHEAEQACALLGVPQDNLHWFNLPDGSIPSAVDIDHEVMEKLAKIIHACQPGEVYVPVPFDCWPDHRQATELVTAAIDSASCSASMIYYPIWMWYNLRIRDLNKLKGWQIFRLDIHSVQMKKQTAMSCYLNDVNPSCGIPYCGKLPTGFTEPFAKNYEIFFRKIESC